MLHRFLIVFRNFRHGKGIDKTKEQKNYKTIKGMNPDLSN